MDERAQMLADLGLDHRDEVSVPAQPSSSAETAVYEHRDEQRRQKAHDQADADAGNPQHAKISAWNKQEMFGGDPMQDGLANRYSGQGHREQLQQQHHPQMNKSHAMAGGDTRRAQGNGASASLSNVPRGDARRIQGNGASASLSNVPRPTQHHQAQAGPSLPKGLANVVPSARTPIRPTGTPTRAARTTATSVADESVSFVTRSQHGSTVRASATAASPDALVTSPSSSGTRTSATTTATILRVPRTKAADNPAPPQAPRAVAVDHYRNMVDVKMAQHYAANPGPKADIYYNMFPERRPYLAKALEEIAQKQTAKVKKMVPIEEVKHAGSSGDKADARKDVPNIEKVVKKVVVDKAPEPKAAVAAKASPSIITKKEIAEDKASITKAVVTEKITPINIKKKAVQDAVIDEKENASTIIKEEIVEKGREVLAPLAPSEQLSRKPSRPETASSAGSSPRSEASSTSASTGLSIPTPPAPSMPQTPMYGKLIVTYLNAEMNHIDTQKIDINAPIHASIQITSKAAAYDPRAIQNAVQNFADGMCLRDRNIRLEHGDDGLYQEI